MWSRLSVRCLGYAFPLAALAGCGGAGGISGGPQGPAKWTILVYLNAANNLFQDSVLNVNQMEMAAGNPQVNIVVQWKQSQAKFPASSFDGTRRYLIKPDQTPAIASELLQNMGNGVDMGSAQTLSDFITWGKANFPAERTALILWDHGDGWRRKMKYRGRAFSYDNQTNHSIQIWDLNQALGNQQFDIIAWDCSLMQMSEVAYQLRNNARYVVGSEESPPEQGFPYDQVLARFRDTAADTTLNLAKSFPDGMLNVALYRNLPIEESVLDTSKLHAISQAVDGLASQLLANNGAIGPLVQNIRANGQQYDTLVSPPRYFFDLWDMSNRMKTGTSIIALQAAASSVQDSVVAAVPYERHNTNSPGSHGLSIDFTPSAQFLSSSADYAKLDFGTANRWGQWLAVSP